MGSEERENGADGVENALRLVIETCLRSGKSIRKVDPGAVFPRHMNPRSHCHAHWEIFAVVGGDFMFESLNSPPELLNEAVFLLIPPGCPHTQADLLEQPARQKVCVISLPDAEGEFSGAVSWILSKGVTTDLNAFSAADAAAWSVLLDGPPGSHMMTAAKALAKGGWGAERACAVARLILCALGEVMSKKAESGAGDSLDPRIVKVLAILHKEFHNPDLAISDLADALRLSSAHLFDIFKRETGTTIHKTLLDIRLRRAKALLEQKCYSVKEVASLTGWGNQLHFSASFRRHYGKPPSKVDENRPRDTVRGSGTAIKL